MQGDKENEFSRAQNLTASGASTNVVRVPKNIGVGEPMCAVITLDEEAEDGDADETYTIKLQSDDAEAFGSAATLGEVVTIPRGSPAGHRVVIPIPPTVLADEYLRLYATLGGTTPSLTFTGRLMPMNAIQNNQVYPAGNTIS